MGDCYREYLKAQQKRSPNPDRQARSDGASEARNARREAFKRKSRRPPLPYGTQATQGRLLDA